MKDDPRCFTERYVVSLPFTSVRSEVAHFRPKETRGWGLTLSRRKERR